MYTSQRECLMFFLCLPVLSCAQQSAASLGAAGQPQPASSSQSPTTSPSLAPAAVVESSQGSIELNVLVTDKSGKPVSGLGLSDFTLLDNNQPVKILSFHAIDGTVHTDDPPIKIILLLDTVNVGFQQVAAERQEIDKYFRQLNGDIGHPMSIYLFTNDGLKFRPEPSSDGKVLAADLKQVDGQLRTIGRSQGGWGDLELILLSIQNLESIARNEVNSPGRKILIWVGPGWPMLDSTRYQTTSSQEQQELFNSIVELSTSLRDAHIALYSISSGQASGGTFLYQDFLKGVKSAPKASPSNLNLKVLAIQSGGRVLAPSNDLAAEIDSCVKDADAFYTLRFDPPHPDKPHEYHDLKVVIGKPGLKALTNTGYYD